jgi:eukaryotic-like serine/threonine-protein kinase
MDNVPSPLELTQSQPQDELQAARELSLTRWQPPTELQGYQPQRCLGVGAFGEVWLALDRSTNRLVAIKYFQPRAGQDWSALAREVEKLAFLAADRYVVQLLDVGWDAQPPYYVMEYLEQGSLEDKLKRDGPLPVPAAVEIFQELAVALAHAHEKGVLHCDLKPGNVLLDQDTRPRLADFGQARLAHEHLPALGTLFYMAPEQTLEQSLPNPRWDIYALGALLYQMLTGAPPFRDHPDVERLSLAPNISDRLRDYREIVRRSPAPMKHRDLRGVDNDLAEIIERCLARQPAERYASMHEVLAALAARARRRAMRPLFALGAIGPAILIALVGLVAWYWFNQSFERSREALTERALSSLRFASRNVAIVVGNELETRFETVEEIAADMDLTTLLAEYHSSEELRKISTKLSDPTSTEMQLQPVRESFREQPELAQLQKHLNKLLADYDSIEYSSWFITDARGLQIARAPESTTIGQNYAWRSYFYGGNKDQPRDWRPSEERLRRTRISACYRNQASKLWTIAISTPLYRQDGSQEFLGVLALTFDIGKNLIPLESEAGQFPVLIDTRPSEAPGLLVQHPFLDAMAREPERELNDRKQAVELTINPERLTGEESGSDDYRDPVSQLATGQDYNQRWLAGWQPVKVRNRSTGWYVLVQQSYDKVLGQTLDELRTGFIWSSILALVVVAVVSVGLWWYCLRMIEANQQPRLGSSKYPLAS